MIDSAELAAKITKLPTWARSYIEHLERDRQELVTRLANLSRQGPDDSNVRVSGHRTRPDIVLPRDTRIDFCMPGRPQDEMKITVHHDTHDPDVLIVQNTSLRGDGALAVTPQSSNTLRIRIGKY